MWASISFVIFWFTILYFCFGYHILVAGCGTTGTGAGRTAHAHDDVANPGSGQQHWPVCRPPAKVHTAWQAQNPM
eukprot:14510590-Alexandrium_andersonii.AAC.1